MKPLAFASATTCEKVLPAPKLLKIKDRVPLRMPSICISSSPVSSRLLRVDMTGNPAPTVPYKHTMHWELYTSLYITVGAQALAVSRGGFALCK